MKKLLFLVVVLASLAAACGGTGAGPEPADGGTAATTTVDASDTTSNANPSDGGDVTSTTGDVGDDPPVAVEGPPAADFTLALGDGSEFVLSAEEKPVYLVFWAEW